MALSIKQKEDIRKARAAYMREYRKKPEFKDWQREYNRRPDVIQRRQEAMDRFWIRKSEEMKKEGAL